MYRKGFANLSPNAAAAGKPQNFQISKYMQMLEKVLENDIEHFIEKFRGIYAFKVKNDTNGDEVYWVVNAKKGKGKITYNGSEKPDVTLSIDDDDVPDFVSGKLTPQRAYMQGKLKIQGNIGLAMKLADLQKQIAGKVGEIHSKL